MSVIFQDDPQALDKLAVKLAKLEKEKAYWKTIKKNVPRKYDQSPEDARWYMLTNVTTRIREVKKKIAKIEERDASGKTLERNITFKNGRPCFFYKEVDKETKN